MIIKWITVLCWFIAVGGDIGVVRALIKDELDDLDGVKILVVIAANAWLIARYA